jgi:hypothetical protein
VNGAPAESRRPLDGGGTATSNGDPARLQGGPGSAKKPGAPSGTTATLATPPIAARGGYKFNMVEQKQPAFFQFKQPGDAIEGMLCAIETVEFVEKRGVASLTRKFTLMGLDTQCFSAFLGTVQLNKQIRFSHLGHFITVIFESVDDTVGREGNGMKVFRVWISDRKVSQLHGAQFDAFVDYERETAQS